MEPKAANFGSSGGRIRTDDLEGMNLMSCLTAPPRDSAGFLRLFCLSLFVFGHCQPPSDGWAYSGGPTNDHLCHVHLPALGAE